MKNYKKIMDNVSKIVFILTGILICAMVIIISWQVFSRFVLNRTPRWSEEFTLVLMLYTGFLGAALAYRERMHIGIKVFLMNMSPLMRNKIYFGIDTLIGIFSTFMIFWGSSFAWFMRNQTLPATKIKVGFSYLPIPLAGLLMLSFVVEKILIDLEERKTGASDDPLNLPPSEV